MGVVLQGAPGRTALLLRGVRLPVLVIGPTGAQAVMAMWDTGSEVTSVDAAILQAVGCRPAGSLRIETVQGGSLVPTYTCAIASDSFGLSHGPIRVLGDSLPAQPGQLRPTRALIGRDIGSLYELVVDGDAGTWAIYSTGATNRAQPRGYGPAIVLGALGAVAAGAFLTAEAVAAG